MSEIPKLWRLQKSFRGNGEGGLIGSVCKACGEKHFPSREGTVCPECNWQLNDKNVPEIQDALGVGVLLLTRKNGVLNLVLFNEICDLVDDLDSKKLERISSPAVANKFSKPNGLNTVTGKVENIDSINLEKLEKPDEKLLKKATSSVQMEVWEEAKIFLPKEKLRLLTSSKIVIDQFRGEYNENEQPIINRFLILAFAALLSSSELETLEKNSHRSVELFDVSKMEILEKTEIRKATRAVLDFLDAALLWIAQLEDTKFNEYAFSEALEKDKDV